MKDILEQYLKEQNHSILENFELVPEKKKLSVISEANLLTEYKTFGDKVLKTLPFIASVGTLMYTAVSYIKFHAPKEFISDTFKQLNNWFKEHGIPFDMSKSSKHKIEQLKTEYDSIAANAKLISAKKTSEIEEVNAYYQESLAGLVKWKDYYHNIVSTMENKVNAAYEKYNDAFNSRTWWYFYEEADKEKAIKEAKIRSAELQEHYNFMKDKFNNLSKNLSEMQEKKAKEIQKIKEYYDEITPDKSKVLDKMKEITDNYERDTLANMSVIAVAVGSLILYFIYTILKSLVGVLFSRKKDKIEANLEKMIRKK